ncbi:hypothetical protein DI383_12505 [Flavobacteriaceae bacterium LYZ1037]|nr:hypothetical protein DI383_12505 [Flavobacteriaceae bacterium LYZ1037]
MKTHQKLKKELIQFRQTDKKSLIIGSVVATILAITPYLFYLYESVPTKRVWDTFLFSYDSGSYENANYVMWLFTGKAIPLLLLFIWFFTCRHWWYHVILVPIAMYLYQIFGIFNDNISFVDEFQLMYLVPLMAIIIPTIYLIRAKMFDKLNTASKTMEELEDEFMIKPKNIWEKIKQYF